jgi:hypothetical protein
MFLFLQRMALLITKMENGFKMVDLRVLVSRWLLRPSHICTVTKINIDL